MLKGMGLTGAALMLSPGLALADQNSTLTIEGNFDPQPYPEVSPCFAGGFAWVSTQCSYAGIYSGSTIQCQGLVTEPEPSTPWRRSYAGVYSAHADRECVYTFIHGENKNQYVNGTPSVNTISRTSTCFSGVTDGVYRDCEQDYYAFCSLAQDNVDRGPIVWPKAGYVGCDGRKLSSGCRHPSSVIEHEGHLYLFYLDTSEGTCVARAPLSDIDAGAFETWCGDNRWIPSLPCGSFEAILSHRGPHSRAILPSGSRSYFFTVTKAQNGFFGIQQHAPTETRIESTLYFSHDLVHWHFIRTLPWTGYGSDPATAWDNVPVQYPRVISGRRVIGVKNGVASIYRF